MLNLSTDRYRFAVGLGAALLRGHTSLLPPNHVADTVARLRARFAERLRARRRPTRDGARPADGRATPTAPAPTRAGVDAIPAIDAALVAAYVLTSGSTGEPVPHAKPWGLLVRNARAEARAARRSALGRADLAGVTLVATVPPQHMYGFESSVLIALHGGAALDAERPFFPADIAAALARAAAPRMLVTTPFHLKTLLDAGIALPPIELVAVRHRAAVAAARGARRGSASARRCSRSTAAPRPARSRRGAPTAGAEWQTFDGLRLDGDGDARHRQRRPRAASRRCSPTCSRSSTRETLPPARPLERPDQHRRQAQLARPPRTSTSTRSTASSTARSGCRPTSERRRGRHRPPGRLRRRARRRARAHRRGAARARRRGLPAAPHRPRRRAAARADRQAHAAARLGRARAPRTPPARPRDERRAHRAAAQRRDRAPTIRRSTATSPASRCCPASPCSPRCSRRRSPSRRWRACIGRGAAPGGRQVPRAGAARARRSTIDFGLGAAASLRVARRRRRPRRRQRPDRARRHRRRRARHEGRRPAPRRRPRWTRQRERSNLLRCCA